MAVQKVESLGCWWGYKLVSKLADQMADWKVEYGVALMVEWKDTL
jgi:hypothetical protein